MQTITNAYLTNLAVADIVIILTMVYDILIRYLLSPLVEKSPYFTDLGCTSVHGILYISGFSSNFLILFVSIERYSAICRPLSLLHDASRAGNMPALEASCSSDKEARCKSDISCVVTWSNWRCNPSVAVW